MGKSTNRTVTGGLRRNLLVFHKQGARSCASQGTAPYLRFSCHWGIFNDTKTAHIYSTVLEGRIWNSFEMVYSRRYTFTFSTFRPLLAGWIFRGERNRLKRTHGLGIKITGPQSCWLRYLKSHDYWMRVINWSNEPTSTWECWRTSFYKDVSNIKENISKG